MTDGPFVAEKCEIQLIEFLNRIMEVARDTTTTQPGETGPNSLRRRTDASTAWDTLVECIRALGPTKPKKP